MNHIHLLATIVNLKAVPSDPQNLFDWLDRLVQVVGMEKLIGPYSIRCDDVGNEGCTGIVGIKTSHASIHVWENPDSEEPNFAKMDLYSCKDFNAWDVLHHMKIFDPDAVYITVYDRNGLQPKTILEVEHDFRKIPK